MVREDAFPGDRKQDQDSVLTLLVHTLLQTFSHTIRGEKEMKGIEIRQEQAKSSLFADVTTVYIEKAL